MTTPESIIDSFTNIISSSLEENTVVWIILTGIIGGIISQILKYVFETSLPEWKKKKTTRIAIQKYDRPIIQSALYLADTITSILKNYPIIENDLDKLSILYNFGCFFGWIKILLNESYIEEVAQTRIKKYRTKSKYQFYLFNMIDGFTYDVYSSKKYLPRSISSISIPRYVVDSIGELMIDKLEEKNQEYKKILSLVEFRKSYQDKEEFKVYFKYIENWIEESQNIRSDSQNNILTLIYIEIMSFYYRDMIKVHRFSSFFIRLFPLKVGSIINKLLWFPKKLIDSINFTKVLIETYRFDLRQLKIFLKNYFDESKKEKENYFRTSSYPIENEIDNLQYYTWGVSLHFNKREFYSRDYNLGMITSIFPYFNYRFLNVEVFDKLKHDLEYLGYINIFNFYYKNELDYIKNFILKNNSHERNAEGLNLIGLIFTYLVGDTYLDKNEKSENFISEAISYYDKSWQLNNKYIGSLINKGLLYLEFCHSRKDYADEKITSTCYGKERITYDDAKECFEKALKIAKLHQNIELNNIYGVFDLLNYLGITYYCLNSYDKAIKCFQEALEIYPSYDFAKRNIKILLRKLNN